MTTGDPFLLDLRDAHRIDLAGGKAANLARLLAAGLDVPDGFVVTAAAFRAAIPQDRVPAALAEEIRRAYRRMSSPPVAVRSSATAEDLAEASMAGQYRTLLDVQGEDVLLRAVETCWTSLADDRVRAYLAERGIDPACVAMAVVVQRLVPAETAGVLFTANPRSGSRDEMLLEASWGLGEAVVSGLVQPDTLVLDRATGRVTSAILGDKRLAVAPGSRQPSPVPEERQRIACLNSRQVDELWRLGLRVAEHFGTPQDIEWAIHGGRVYLLQSRPITTLDHAEARRDSLEETRAELRREKDEGRGGWVLHNLAETLPHPTPLTWSVVRRFMSGDGGFGQMYRMVGFEPSPAACRDGFLDLVAGRVYMDLSRGPEMFFEGFPYRYDLELLRVDPDAAQGPPTVPAGSALQQYRVGRRIAAIHRNLETLARDFDRQFEAETIPEFREYVAAEQRRDLPALDAAGWRDLWAQRERRVLQEFAPRSLLPSLIAAMAIEELRAFLEEHFWDEDPRALAALLSAGGEPDQTLRAGQGLFELAQGRETLETWLAAHGHRAPEEFDLASPRWREKPEAVRAMADRLKDGSEPLAMHQRRAAESDARLQELAGRLRPALGRELEERVRLARRYLRFREDGKHYLMLGYGLLRDLALEAGRRLEIGPGVFLLTLEELHGALATGFAPLALIDDRRRRRAAEAKLALPQVIAKEDIDRLGEPVGPPQGNRCEAFPISGGTCRGPARVVLSPEEAGDLGRGYVLVCPSTDPSWTPLFIGAAGLVLECGGTLSHGAVVAREMGLPAVVYPGATQAFHDGETLLVDGDAGQVCSLSPVGQVCNLSSASCEPTPGATGYKPVLRGLPPVGRKERWAARVRNGFLAFWGVFLLAAFLLPEGWLYGPSMRAFDLVLWPMVAAWGKPAAVAAVAAVLAVLTMLGQRLLTDNARLLVAKRRAAELRKRAAEQPEGSPERIEGSKAAAGVTRRLVGASFVPLAAILGPMVLSFLWFPGRVDPASWNARPGATVYLVASVEGEYAGPVTLEHDEALRLDPSTPAVQSLPPIRATLEARLAQWQKESDLSGLPWELQEAGRWIGKGLREDLAEYLAGDLPPQTLAWTLATPEEQTGRFPVALSVDGHPAVETWVVLGDDDPPEPKEDLGDGKGPVQLARPREPASPVRWVRTAYFDPQQERRVFWAPLASLGWDGDAGWLGTYLLAYLPAMFLFRRLLRLA